MSKYFTAFDESTQTIGSTIVGWTNRNGYSTAVPAFAAFNVLPYRRRYLAYTPPNSGSVNRCATLDVIDADANRAAFDLVTAFPFDLATVDDMQLFARGQGSVTDFYKMKLVLATGALSIDKFVASVFTANIGTATVTLAAGRSYFMRFRGNGTTLQAKVWDSSLGSAGEPTAWNISITDSSLTAAGWVGIHGKPTGSSKLAPFNFFSVGTNGDSAFCPRTETEFDNAIDDQRNVIEVLAELSALGYDPTGAGSPAYTKTVNAYWSRGGFASQAWDTPASQPYAAVITGVPSFSVEMPTAGSGEARVNFGELVIDNARPSSQPQDSTTVGLKFDGVNQSVALGTVAVATTFTIEAWIRPSPTATTTGWIFSNYTGAGDGIQFFTDTNGVVTLFRIAGGALVASISTLVPVRAYGQLVHVAATVDGATTTAKIYINGVQVATSASFTAGASSNNGVIGRDRTAGANYYTGTIDEVRFWNVTRSAAQILALFNQRATGSETGLIGCWHMDEGSGTTTADASPTGNTGTLTSAAMWSMTGMPKASKEWGGTYDDLLRMKVNKNYLRMWIGVKGLAKADFREYLTGCVGQLTAPSERQISIKVSDLSAFFQKDLQTSLFTSGEYTGQRKPIFFGQIGRASHVGGQIEPPLTDAANLIYTISDAAIGAWWTSTTDYMRVFDRQSELRTAALTISAVAGNVMTSSANHGMTVNYLVRFHSGTPPTPLALNTDYWVQSAPAANTFTLSATRGGAVITLTSATTGAAFHGFGYTVTITAPATIQLASGDYNQMRITVSDILSRNAGPYATGNTPKQVYADIVARTGLSANFIDTGTAYSLSNDCGYWLDTQKRSAADVLAAFAGGTLSYYGFSPAGLFYNGAIVPPSGTPVQSFGTWNITANSMRSIGTRRAVDFSKSEVSYAPWFLTGGAFQSGSQAAVQGRSITAPTVYGAVTPPLDGHPAAGEADVNFAVTHFFTASTPVTVYSTLYAKPLDEFEFRTTLRAYRRRIGEVIGVTYPRFGFKQWSVTDPASLDNTATIDGTLAVIDKISVALSWDNEGRANPDPVTVQCYKAKIGYYSTVNL